MFRMPRYLCLLVMFELAVLAGCRAEQEDLPGESVERPPAGGGGEHADHDHPAAGPHGGHLIVLGDEQFHAELVDDETTHTLTVYLLDASAEQAVASDQQTVTLSLFEEGKFTDYTLTAVGEAADNATAFSTADEQLVHRLLHAEGLRGRLRVSLGGQEYTGAIDHDAHEHDGHRHE